MGGGAEQNVPDAQFGSRRRAIARDLAHEQTIGRRRDSHRARPGARQAKRRDADPAMDDGARAQIRQELLGDVDGNGEIQADAPALVADDAARNAHDGSVEVDERPAAAAGIDRRVGLEELDSRSVEAAPLGAENPGRDGVMKAQWIADRDDVIAHVQAIGVAERSWAKTRGIGNPQQREVGVWVGANDRRVQVVAVRRSHVDQRCALHHVRVGQNQPCGIDHDARSESFLNGPEQVLPRRLGRRAVGFLPPHDGVQEHHRVGALARHARDGVRTEDGSRGGHGVDRSFDERAAPKPRENRDRSRGVGHESYRRQQPCVTEAHRILPFATTEDGLGA